MNERLLISALLVIGYLAVIPGMYMLCLFIDDGLGTPHRANKVQQAILWPTLFLFFTILTMFLIVSAWQAIFKGGWRNIQTTWEKYHAE